MDTFGFYSSTANSEGVFSSIKKQEYAARVLGSQKCRI